MAPAALFQRERSRVPAEARDAVAHAALPDGAKLKSAGTDSRSAAAPAALLERVPLASVSMGSQRALAHASPPDARLARYAVTALIDEAQLTPKPALVDRRGSGAHRDLDLATMLRSAHALEPTFAALARVARRHAEPSTVLRTELAQIGRAGERDMLNATGGSNAHRGAIWIIGLLIAGASLPSGSVSGSASQIGTRAARIARFPDRFAAPSDSHGERARQRYQVGGARREAQDGFPHVIEVGLPALLAARERGIDEDAARVDALLSIMASLDDTCLLHRAGLAGLHAGQTGAQRVLDAGGSSTPAGRAAFAALDHALLSLDASPGGAADLLAATLFLDMLAHHDANRSPDSWNI